MQRKYGEIDVPAYIFLINTISMEKFHFDITGYNIFTVVCKNFFHAMKGTENEDSDTIRNIVEGTNVREKICIYSREKLSDIWLSHIQRGF